MHCIRKVLFLILLLFSVVTFAHGVIESPASREQLCGVESKPDEIFKDKMTHEECRPIMTKENGEMDNSVYNFMAVLTHTAGRSNRPIEQLPKYVCGFGSEMWSGGKTPWDKAINWPTVQVKSGVQNFTWNISWGNHFGDTEEFVYWITKSDFQFNPNKELTWNDFEPTPFCHLKYNDQSPTNPNIVADKARNRFITTCNVPVRQNRSVIYAEWGRNKNTLERFHSCIDAVFTATPPPTLEAVIAPFSEIVTGAGEITLDGSQSVGTDLSYQWSIDAENLTPYQLQNSTSKTSRLFISNVNAEQIVTVTLTVTKGDASSRVSRQFKHTPVVAATWKTVGRATLDSTLKAGDKVQLRLIDSAGKDYFLPSTPLVLTTDTSRPDTWAYVLAQLINPSNQFSAKIGVLASDNKTVEPIRSATANMIYVPVASTIVNGYVQLEKAPDPIENCFVQRKSGSGSYWLGYDVYSNSAPILLDFTLTGIKPLDDKLIIDKGVFNSAEAKIQNLVILPTKPQWVSKTVPGFLGFFGPNYGSYEPFNTPLVPTCQAGNGVLKKLLGK